MLVQDLISLAMRTSGILGVGQVALPQDLTDTQNLLLLMLQQWRQKRWLVYRLTWRIFPLEVGKQSYTIGPGSATGLQPDVDVGDGPRPANIQSCYLRQNVGSGPNSFPVDFPMNVMGSRQEYDAIRLKFLQSWPASIYYDPTLVPTGVGGQLPSGTLYIWPIPVQNLFSLYIAWQYSIDAALQNAEASQLDLELYLPPESQLAIMYNLALLLAINYKLPPDPELSSAARSSLNTMRMTNYAMQPLAMPAALARHRRWQNPNAGFYPEIAAGVPVTTLG